MTDLPKDFRWSRRGVIRGAAAVVASGALSSLTSSAQAAVPFASERLAVITRGERGPRGRDILLIPGLASGPAIWSSLVTRLAGHRLHLVHVSGFAKRPAGANATGPLLNPLVAELARYVAAEGLRAPVIIGHSMGGTLGLMLALRADVRAAQLMVVDMLPDGSAMLGGTAQGYGYLATQLNGYLTGTKAGRQMLADMVRQTPGGRDSDPRVIAQALTELAQADLAARLRSLACPLTVVPALPGRSDLDNAQLRRYRAAYAGVKQLTVAGIGPSGHQVMLDQPEKFAEAVRKFLV
ncbi:alpha/beta hydrolase [Sphingobium sp. DEHP117]|nr:alpha/beta hydrolase [Sphingobium sp. DEHP117]